MKKNMFITTVYNVNKFHRRPDLDDGGEYMFMENPELWWDLNIVLKSGEQNYEDITHENVAKNGLQIEEWLGDSFSYTVVVTPYIDTQVVKEEITKVVKYKGGLFSSDREKEIKETKETETRTAMWRFWFREQSDAVLFSTAWKGEESK